MRKDSHTLLPSPRPPEAKCRLNAAFRVLAALALLAVPAVAQEASYLTVVELQRSLVELFKQEARVEGSLTALGEFAVLQDTARGEVMVDLRELEADLRRDLNEKCEETACDARLSGRVVHIRGEGISELGLLAEEVELAGAD